MRDLLSVNVTSASAVRLQKKANKKTKKNKKKNIPAPDSDEQHQIK